VTKPLTLAAFLALFGDMLDAARFAASVLDKPEDRLYHAADRTWWRRVGNALKAADPPALLAVADAAMAHPSTAVRHSDYCKGEPCTCPEEVREREAKRRQTDPLLRAVDQARRAR